MHSEWDRAPNDLMGGPNAALIQKAKLVLSTPGERDEWPTIWASETVRAAHTAFTGVTFSGNGPRWDVFYSDRAVYVETQDKPRRDQMSKGGARLAELLKALLQ